MLTTYNVQPEGLRITTAALPPDQEAEIRDDVWLDVVTGTSPDPIIEALVDDFGLSDDDARSIVMELVDARIAQQAGFGTVPTPLADAFQTLNDAGVVAQGNVGDCETCFHEEIRDYMDPDERWLGYIGFHQQDAVRIAETGTSFLSYGLVPSTYLTAEQRDAMSEADRTRFYDHELAELLRTRILPVLTAHGLEPEWDGDIRSRITVHNAELYIQARKPDTTAEYYLDAADEPVAIVDNEEAGWEGVFFNIDLDDAGETIAFTRSTDDTETEPAGVAVVVGDRTAYNAIAAVSLPEPDQLHLALDSDAAEELGVPQEMIFAGVGDMTAAFEKITAMRDATGFATESLGTGGENWHHRQPGLETIVLSARDDRIALALIDDAVAAEEVPMAMGKVMLTLRGNSYVDAINEWRILDENTLRMGLEPDDDGDLPAELIFEQDDPRGTQTVYEHVLGFLQRTGEADNDGNIVRPADED